MLAADVVFCFFREGVLTTEVAEFELVLLLLLTFLLVGETLMSGVKQSGAPCSIDFKAFDSAVGEALKGDVLTSILIRVVILLDNLLDLAGLPLFFFSGDSPICGSWSDIVVREII